jgi:aryl-alcohol dehydrogenase-like predicted oxidoreductase
VLKRPYGDTGVSLSIVGLGGIVVANLPQADADRIVAAAVERGVNYFDVAPTYGDAEDRLGPALKPFRDDVFLACKTEKRSRTESAAALRTSLDKLQTDHVDLYQVHGLQSLDDARAACGPDGALGTLVEARDSGAAKFLGFSSHSVEAALYCMEQFDFDSVLFPLTFPSYYKGFGPQVVAEAQRRGLAVLALKAMAHRPWPEGAERRAAKCWYEPFDAPDAAETALRWTLTLPVTAAIAPGEPVLFDLACDIAERFTPLGADAIRAVESQAASIPALFATN